MTIAYWDLGNGVTPRMMLGALLSAGVRADLFRETMQALLGTSWKLNLDDCSGEARNGVCASVGLPEGPVKKTVGELKAEITAVKLPEAVQRTAQGILQRVSGTTNSGEGLSLATTEWSETLCVLLGYETLSIQRSYRSHFAFGREATIDALRMAEGHTVRMHHDQTLPCSLIGVTLMLTLAPAAGDPPVFPLSRVGIGYDSCPPSSECGTLRLLLGSFPSVTIDERVYQVDATIDDMNPELYPAILSLLRKQGALDSWWTGTVTRDGRPGATISVLVPPEMLPGIVTAMLEETTSIGVRFHEVSRRVLRRHEYQIDTTLGRIGVKESVLPSGKTLRKAELRDCQRLAEQSGISVREVQAIVNQEIGKQRSTS